MLLDLAGNSKTQQWYKLQALQEKWWRESDRKSGTRCWSKGRLWRWKLDTGETFRDQTPVIYFDELVKVSDSSHGQEIIGILTHLKKSKTYKKKRKINSKKQKNKTEKKSSFLELSGLDTNCNYFRNKVSKIGNESTPTMRKGTTPLQQRMK